MDPLEGVKAWKDTSYFLMLACCQRGHEVCYLDQRDLWLEHDDLYATVQWLQVNEDVKADGDNHAAAPSKKTRRGSLKKPETV